jgi:hypothetical protein
MTSMKQGRVASNIPGVIENPKSQCPMNHPDSKFYASRPDQHILLCKCECPWCQDQFHEKPAFSNTVGLDHSGTGKD